MRIEDTLGFGKINPLLEFVVVCVVLFGGGGRAETEKRGRSEEPEKERARERDE